MLLSPYIMAIIGLSAILSLCFAYLSKSKERNARLKELQIAKFTKRTRKLDSIIFGLPPNYLPKTLKILIYASIVDSLRQMHSLSGMGNIDEQIARVKTTLSTLIKLNPSDDQVLNSENFGTELREYKYLLKDLHTLIIEFHKEGTINRQTAQTHLALVRKTMLKLTLDTYKLAAEQAMISNNKGLALHYFSMATQRLEQDAQLEGLTAERQFYADKVKQLEQELAATPASGFNTQTDALDEWKAIEKDDSWKKQRY